MNRIFGFRFSFRTLLFASLTGEVAEWSIVPDSKSGVSQGTVGSNPTLSAISLAARAALSCSDAGCFSPFPSRAAAPCEPR